MAITKSITTEQGFVAPDAYIRITNFRGDKNSVQVNIEIHKDAQARIDNFIPFANYSLSLSLTDGATMQQMYNALKEDPNFTGAVDC